MSSRDLFSSSALARWVYEADSFVSVQLTEQEPGARDKCRTDCARWDTIDWAWKRISYEMKDHGIYIIRQDQYYLTLQK
jgi:hypothetical protein